jgi:L-ascorbate metabolism protein UlaG (beta-lactamase superfamily)
MQRNLILLAALVFTSSLRGSQAPRLELTYLANMGVLLERDGKRIVIDGFHHGALEEYASVPPSLLGPLEQSRAPFRALDLLLTTHRHLDHFDASSVAARLASDSTAVYVAATETVDSLFARTTLRASHPGVVTRIRAISPPGHAEVRVPLAGIDLTVLDLAHNPTPSKRVANVAFLLNLGGVRVLHVGDADPTAANFDPHRLAQRSIDVAIVPFWYLTNPSSSAVRSIGAKTWIATHVPPSDSASVRRKVVDAMPGAIVLTTPGQRYPIR